MYVHDLFSINRSLAFIKACLSLNFQCKFFSWHELGAAKKKDLCNIVMITGRGMSCDINKITICSYCAINDGILRDEKECKFLTAISCGYKIETCASFQMNAKYFLLIGNYAVCFDAEFFFLCIVRLWKQQNLDFFDNKDHWTSLCPTKRKILYGQASSVKLGSYNYIFLWKYLRCLTLVSLILLSPVSLANTHLKHIVSVEKQKRVNSWKMRQESETCWFFDCDPVMLLKKYPYFLYFR